MGEEVHHLVQSEKVYVYVQIWRSPDCGDQVPRVQVRCSSPHMARQGGATLGMRANEHLCTSALHPTTPFLPLLSLLVSAQPETMIGASASAKSQSQRSTPVSWTTNATGQPKSYRLFKKNVLREISSSYLIIMEMLNVCSLD